MGGHKWYILTLSLRLREGEKWCLHCIGLYSSMIYCTVSPHAPQRWCWIMTEQITTAPQWSWPFDLLVLKCHHFIIWRWSRTMSTALFPEQQMRQHTSGTLSFPTSSVSFFCLFIKAERCRMSGSAYVLHLFFHMAAEGRVEGSTAVQNVKFEPSWK